MKSNTSQSRAHSKNRLKFQDKENYNQLNIQQGPLSARNHQKNVQHQSFIVFCQGGDGRKATHCIIEDDDIITKYCQKCSIMLASQGFNVVKLNNNSALTYRQNFEKQKRASHSVQNEGFCQKKNKFSQIQSKPQISYRLSEVLSIKQNILFLNSTICTKNNCIGKLLQQSQKHYSIMITKVNAYFEQIQQALQLQKYLAYNRILTERAQQQKCIRQHKQILNQIKQQLKGILNDLEDNVDMIKIVDHHSYQLIMKPYIKKVNQVPFYLDQPIQIKQMAIQILSFSQNLDNISQNIHFYSTNDSNKMSFCQYEQFDMKNNFLDQTNLSNTQNTKSFQKTSNMQKQKQKSRLPFQNSSFKQLLQSSMLEKHSNPRFSFQQDSDQSVTSLNAKLRIHKQQKQKQKQKNDKQGNSDVNEINVLFQNQSSYQQDQSFYRMPNKGKNSTDNKGKHSTDNISKHSTNNKGKHSSENYLEFLQPSSKTIIGCQIRLQQSLSLTSINQNDQFNEENSDEFPEEAQQLSVNKSKGWTKKLIRQIYNNNQCIMDRQFYNNNQCIMNSQQSLGVYFMSDPRSERSDEESSHQITQTLLIQ